MMRDDGSSIEMMIGGWWRVTEGRRLVAGPSITLERMAWFGVGSSTSVRDESGRPWGLLKEVWFKELMQGVRRCVCESVRVWF